MKVTIITATYNSEKYLEECINSVVAQDYPDIEHIVVDGKSNDRTLDIVRSFNNHLARWISEPDRGMYDAINKVRTRAQLPGLPAGLSQVAMRTDIHRERRIELAFEDKRWWDLIRWNIADIKLNGQLHGIAINVGPGGKLTYNPVTVPGGDRKFNAGKNYLFPVPQSAIDRNKKLKQNPGY